MGRFHKNRKGQNITEYLILVAGVLVVVILATSKGGFFTKGVDKSLNMMFDSVEDMAEGRVEGLEIPPNEMNPSGLHDKPYYALADLIAPKDRKVKDYLGGFAVTAGIGARELAAQFEREHDDYKSILVKALADRLAEAFAERMHQLVRRKYWGYVPDENLSNEDLIHCRYLGIRPAPGYPACPDHTEKELLFNLLDVEKSTGIHLTESFAMMPAASVSGIYFSHPDARYFWLGDIDKDQVSDYAERKGWDVKTAERWLGPNLGYKI